MMNFTMDGKRYRVRFEHPTYDRRRKIKVGRAVVTVEYEQRETYCLLEKVREEPLLGKSMWETIASAQAAVACQPKFDRYFAVCDEKPRKALVIRESGDTFRKDAGRGIAFKRLITALELSGSWSDPQIRSIKAAYQPWKYGAVQVSKA